MAQGSHHFISVQNREYPSPPVRWTKRLPPDSELDLQLRATAHRSQDPERVAMVLAARQRVCSTCTTSTPATALQVQVALNAIFAKGKFEKAASLISYNSGIASRAPHAEVSGDCTPGVERKVLSTCSRTRIVAASSRRSIPRRCRTRQWAKTSSGPPTGMCRRREVLGARAVPDIQTQASTSTTVRLHERSDQVVTAGPSANTNEMCMAIMYYFPASAGGSCNSLVTGETSPFPRPAGKAVRAPPLHEVRFAHGSLRGRVTSPLTRAHVSSSRCGTCGGMDVRPIHDLVVVVRPITNASNSSSDFPSSAVFVDVRARPARRLPTSPRMICEAGSTVRSGVQVRRRQLQVYRLRR